MGVLPTLFNLHGVQLGELVVYLNCYFSGLSATTWVFNVLLRTLEKMFFSQDLVIVAAEGI